MADVAEVVKLAERGFYVFPVDHPGLPRCAGPRTRDHDPATCRERGKHPAVKWSTRATTDPEVIAADFTGSPRNVGIAGGPSGLVVVDEDQPDAFATFAAARAIPPTFTVATGNGRHFYFRQPPGEALGNAEGLLRRSGCNIRGAGGFVVGPGSEHASGRRYEVVDDRDPAPCPDWLVAALSGAPPDDSGEPFDSAQPLPEPSTWWRDGAIEPGQRDESLMAAAGYAHSKGMADDAAAMLLREVLSRHTPAKYDLAYAMEKLHRARRDYEGAPVKEPPGEEEAAGAEPAPFDGAVFDANDLDAIPPAEHLISDVLEAQTVTVLAGKFGTYKTFVALAWAASVATGKPWGGREVPGPVPVVYVAAEGYRGVRARLAAWRSANGDIPRGMLTVVARPVRLTDRAELAWLSELVADRGARLVVLDTLARCSPGVEENSNKEAGQVFDRLASLRDDHGCAVLILHHTGHPGERSRGASAIEDNADASWVIRFDGQDQEDRSASNPRVLYHRKAKDAELGEPTSLRLHQAAGSAYVDADPFSNAQTRKRDRIEQLVSAADRWGFPLDAGYRRLVELFKAKGVQVSESLARAVAQQRQQNIDGHE